MSSQRAPFQVRTGRGKPCGHNSNIEINHGKEPGTGPDSDNCSSHSQADGHTNLSSSSSSSEQSSLQSSDSSSSDEEGSETKPFRCALWRGRDCRTAILNACESNNCVALRWLLGQGATWGDVNATDANGRTGLAVASCCGFAGVVSVLLQCPLVDVQVPDNEGNTALMLAVQAGDVGITRQLLCVEAVVARGALEVPNALGLSALMQAAVQGRLQCARQLVLAGADMEVRDSSRGLRAQEWALLGGRADTAALLERLAKRRRPEWLQRDGYRLGSPCLGGNDDHASSTGQGAAGRFLRALRALTDACFPGGPQDNGALDHMVRATTAVSGPFVGTACKPCFGEITRDSGATVEAPPSAATTRGGYPKVTGPRAGAPPYLRGASRGRGRVAWATGWWMLTRPWRLRVGVCPESPLPSIRLSKVGRVTPAPEEGARSPRGLQSAQLLCVPGP